MPRNRRARSIACGVLTRKRMTQTEDTMLCTTLSAASTHPKDRDKRFMISRCNCNVKENRIKNQKRIWLIGSPLCEYSSTYIGTDCSRRPLVDVLNPDSRGLNASLVTRDGVSTVVSRATIFLRTICVRLILRLILICSPVRR